MNVKLFEIRDAGTCIPCMGIAMRSHDPRESGIIRHAGFSLDDSHILFGRVDGGQFHYDPYGFPQNPRTMHVAHLHVSQNWNDLNGGEVIDVEFILGMRDTVKEPEIEPSTR